MSGGAPHENKHVKFTDKSAERVGKWVEHASDEEWGLVSETVMRVVEGTWRSKCEYYQDDKHPLTWHIRVRNGLIMTVRFAQEYPSYVQLIYLGPL